MSEAEEVKVGNFNKATKRPTPKGAVQEVAAETTAEPTLAELNAKVDKMLEFMQAMDWKMWVYLKANNYID
ncbi:hypothetical protein UFOVP71_396 [uncultured Caudovirales phage]|uniref:Uncharacterized protein n=1 Tax=uncultured Caudovirales phage TaxID=2100421 RepID=A0A6J5TAA2_9CAUD|nr:hypothetical protein UFOVP71_396 [uncultured Caudovirales phage]